MTRIVTKGATSVILHVFVADSTAGDGSGLTGLVYNSAGLSAYYMRAGAASATAISLVTATVGTFASGGFKEIDATNLPGWYELHLPNAAVASGAAAVAIMLKGAAKMVPVCIVVQLTDFDLQTATQTTNLNLTQTNTSSNDATQIGGQIRRTHALVGGTKTTQDHAATNAPIKHRNEADGADLITITPGATGTTSTFTPS